MSGSLDNSSIGNDTKIRGPFTEKNETDYIEDSYNDSISDDIYKSPEYKKLSYNEKLEVENRLILKKLKVKRLERQNMIGQMSFNVPDTMTVGTQYIAKVSLTKSLSSNIQSEGFNIDEIKSLKIVDSLKLSSRVMVSLKDPSGGEYFIVKTINSNSETQSVNEKANSMWKWYVQPIVGGNHQLVLLVSNRLDDDDNRAENEILKPAFERIITVQSNYIYTSKAFWNNYWQWIIGTIAIPLLAFGYAYYKTKKEKDQGDEQRRKENRLKNLDE